MKLFSLLSKQPKARLDISGFDAASVTRTIDAALASAGLDVRSGPMRAVTDGIARALGTVAGTGSNAPTTAAPTAFVERVQEAGANVEAPPSRGGQRLKRTHTGPAGSRSYDLYLPAPRAGAESPPAALPLLVMLHGCTQSPGDFALGTGMNALADEHGLLVCYPAQTQNANGNRCWNWFRGQDQARDGGEPALIAGIVRDIALAHRVDARRVFVAGLSAGAAMAVILGRTHPELFAAVGVHSGLAYAAAHDVPSAFQAMAARTPAAPAVDAAASFVPTIVFHGDQDATVHAANGAQVVTQALADAVRARPSKAPLAASVEQGATASGSRYTRTVYRSPEGTPRVEEWVVHGAGHAWSGGNAAGTYTAPAGPDASAAMVRFFLAQQAGATASPH